MYNKTVGNPNDLSEGSLTNPSGTEWSKAKLVPKTCITRAEEAQPPLVRGAASARPFKTITVQATNMKRSSQHCPLCRGPYRRKCPFPVAPLGLPRPQAQAPSGPLISHRPPGWWSEVSIVRHLQKQCHFL